ncbi:MAG: ATPase, T2SS/T4P/T4SS family, partial [Candidatus Contendobacter sp.]|nr:ATPase, T2SS/T4P/T4SS family [Candidatus Contendobacter sp.]
FTHQHKKSVIAQREIGIDTHDYENALRSAMREAPDVILVGEVRAREVMKYVLTFSETGHLVLSTLHANNANGALDRIVNFFPEDVRPQLLLDLSLNLRAIISQRLVRSLTGGLVPAVEVLLNTPYIADLIQKGKIDYVKDAMEQSTESGTQTFDQSLFKLYREGKISKEEAIKNADSKNNVGLKIRLAESAETTSGARQSANLADLAIHDEDEDDRGRAFGV